MSVGRIVRKLLIHLIDKYIVATTLKEIQWEYNGGEKKSMFFSAWSWHIQINK